MKNLTENIHHIYSYWEIYKLIYNEEEYFSYVLSMFTWFASLPSFLPCPTMRMYVIPPSYCPACYKIKCKL